MENRMVHTSIRSTRLLLLTSSGILALMLVLLLVAGSSYASAQVPSERSLSQSLQSQSQSPIIIEFYYSGDDHAIASAAADNFAYLLSLETGMDILADIQMCEDKIIEHLGNGEADIASLSSVGYVIGNEKYGIEAELVNGQRYAYEYRSQLNVPSASGFLDIWDLQNTRFTAPVPDSLSGYMVPYLMISETTGMTPSMFFSEVNFAGSHNQVIEDVYTGAAECGGTYEDARIAVQSMYPDVLDVVDVLSVSDNIPYDPWAFRQGLDEGDVQILTDGIISVFNTLEGENALKFIFGDNMTGIAATEDSAYDIYRDLVRTFGLQLNACTYNFLPSVAKSCCE